MEEVRTIDAVERIRPRPLLIVMGTEESGQPLADELFAKVREYAQTWRIQGAGHGNFAATEPVEYPRRLRAFLDAALLPEGAVSAGVPSSSGKAAPEQPRP
jgi:hypothetical protein